MYFPLPSTARRYEIQRTNEANRKLHSNPSKKRELSLPTRPPSGHRIFAGASRRLRSVRSTNHALYAIHRVRTTFEMGTHEKLSQQPHREQLYSKQAKYESQDKQRPVLDEDGNMLEDLLKQEHEKDNSTGKHSEKACLTKKVQRIGHITQQKPNGENVKQDPESSGDSVVGLPTRPNDIADGHFDDFRAIPRGERRDESVQFPVQVDVFDRFAAIYLESRPEIMDLHA